MSNMLPLQTFTPPARPMSLVLSRFLTRPQLLTRRCPPLQGGTLSCAIVAPYLQWFHTSHLTQAPPEEGHMHRISRLATTTLVFVACLLLPAGAGAANLLMNGDFSLGNAGFTSSSNG
jgi:hypothetical protein